MKGVWDEIQSVCPLSRCTCGRCTCDVGKKLTESKEKERLYEFLLGLDDTFSTVRTQILTTKPTPTLGEAYHLVAEDEQQREISATRRVTQEAAAFQSLSLNKRESSFDPNNQRNKPPSKEVKRGNQDLEHCTVCGKNSHNKNGCFKVIGYPDWWPGKGKKEKENPKASWADMETSPVAGLTKEQYQMVVKRLSIDRKMDGLQNTSSHMSGKSLTDNSWIVDTGASEHMTGDNHLLENTVTFDYEAPVTIPNGALVPVEGKGNYKLPNGLNLRKVLYVPNFNCNLLSVRKLTDDLNCVVTFFHGFCVAQDLDTKGLIGVGKRDGGFYRMDSEAKKIEAMSIA